MSKPSLKSLLERSEYIRPNELTKADRIKLLWLMRLNPKQFRGDRFVYGIGWVPFAPLEKYSPELYKEWMTQGHRFQGKRDET